MATKKTERKPGTERKPYTLKKGHTHQGDDLEAGATVHLTARQTTWLKSEGVI
jgi:hypothetical protein